MAKVPRNKTQDLLDGTVLDELFQVILERRGADPETSHTAKLFERGTKKIAQKVGEEAVEALIEAVDGKRGLLAEESADLLYYLMVLWAACDLQPAHVYQVLASRRRVAKLFKPEEAEGDEI